MSPGSKKLVGLVGCWSGWRLDPCITFMYFGILCIVSPGWTCHLGENVTRVNMSPGSKKLVGLVGCWSGWRLGPCIKFMYFGILCIVSPGWIYHPGENVTRVNMSPGSKKLVGLVRCWSGWRLDPCINFMYFGILCIVSPGWICHPGENVHPGEYVTRVKEVGGLCGMLVGVTPWPLYKIYVFWNIMYCVTRVNISPGWKCHPGEYVTRVKKVGGLGAMLVGVTPWPLYKIYVFWNIMYCVTRVNMSPGWKCHPGEYVTRVKEVGGLGGMLVGVTPWPLYKIYVFWNIMYCVTRVNMSPGWKCHPGESRVKEVGGLGGMLVGVTPWPLYNIYVFWNIMYCVARVNMSLGWKCHPGEYVTRVKEVGGLGGMLVGVTPWPLYKIYVFWNIMYCVTRVNISPGWKCHPGEYVTRVKEVGGLGAMLVGVTPWPLYKIYVFWNIMYCVTRVNMSPGWKCHPGEYVTRVKEVGGLGGMLVGVTPWPLYKIYVFWNIMYCVTRVNMSPGSKKLVRLVGCWSGWRLDPCMKFYVFWNIMYCVTRVNMSPGWKCHPGEYVTRVKEVGGLGRMLVRVTPWPLCKIYVLCQPPGWKSPPGERSYWACCLDEPLCIISVLYIIWVLSPGVRSRVARGDAFDPCM